MTEAFGMGMVGASSTQGLTTLAPLPRLWSNMVRMSLRLKEWTGPDRILRRHGGLREASVVVLDSLPQQRRRQRYSYIVFIADFDGPWTDQIDVLARVIPRRLTLLWGPTYSFAGARMPRDLRSYLSANRLLVNHYYQAHAGVTSVALRAAGRLDEAFRRMVEPFLDADDDTLVHAWAAFLTDRQRDL